MAKEQVNFRISGRGRALLVALTEHYTARADSGRRATQAEVIERAIRLLAAREKVSEKSPDRD